MVAFLMTGVNAGMECNLTTTLVSEGTEMNVTYNVTTDDVELIYAGFYATSSRTGNTSVLVANISNTTATNHINFTFGNDVVLEDANDYSWTIKITNGSGVGTACTTTGTIVVDRTKPTDATSLSPVDETKDTDGDVDFSGTVQGENVTSCSLVFESTNPGNSRYAMSHSGNTCSVSLADMSESVYIWYIEPSDGRNVSESTRNTLTVSRTSGSARKAKVLSVGAGQPATKEGVAKGLQILNEKAKNPGTAKIREAIAKETKPMELAKTGGTAVAGGVIGTFVFPVIGTAVGAGIGAIIGVFI